MSDEESDAPAPPPSPEASRRPKRRRLRFILLGLTLLILGVLATPFLFAGTLLHYLIAHSAYRNLPLRFSSASLSPWGALTVRGLVIEDQKESAGKPLASADAVHVTFSWRKIGSGRIKVIHVDNIDTTLRPGDDTALTLLRLFSPDADSPATASVTSAPTPAPTTASTTTPATAPASPAESGFWFDELVITGKLRVEGYDPWRSVTPIHEKEAFPAQLTVTAGGTAAAPVRDFTLTVGQPDAPGKPALVTHLRLHTVGNDSVLTLDSLALSNLLGKSTLTADARLNTSTGTLEKATVRVRGLEGADIANALPGVTATGKMEGDLEYAATTAGGTLAVSLNPAGPLTVKVPEGAITLTGTPAFSLHATYDAAGHSLAIDTANLHGIDALIADKGFVQHLQTALAPEPKSTMETILKRLADGAFGALGDLSITGRINLAAAPAPLFTGTFSLKELSLGKTADAPIAEKVTLALGLTVPLSATPDFSALRITEGALSADKLTAGKNTASNFSATLSGEQGRLFLKEIAISFADGTGKGNAALTLPAQLDALHLDFTHIDQGILTQALYPTVFTAEGHISAKLALDRKPGTPLTGSIDLTAEEPGRLKISRESAEGSFGQAAKAVAAAPGSMLPPNFDDIAVGQLANYPYDRGHLVVQDDAGGLLLKFDYHRPPLTPGEPGYGVAATVAGQQVKANFPLQLGPSIGLKNSVTEILGQLLGLRDSVLAPVTSRPTSAPATAASTATKPTTTRP